MQDPLLPRVPVLVQGQFSHTSVVASGWGEGTRCSLSFWPSVVTGATEIRTTGTYMALGSYPGLDITRWPQGASRSCISASSSLPSPLYICLSPQDRNHSDFLSFKPHAKLAHHSSTFEEPMMSPPSPGQRLSPMCGTLSPTVSMALGSPCCLLLKRDTESPWWASTYFFLAKLHIHFKI